VKDLKFQADTKTNESALNFRAFFESSPGHYLVLRADSQFTIVAVSQAYAQTTMTKRDELLGRGIFEVFPDNPADQNPTGAKNLRASLERVLANRVADAMAVQRYDVRRSAYGDFEERYLSPVNSPVLNEKGEVTHIIHQVEDVTAFVRAKLRGVEQEKLTEALRDKTTQMEREIFSRAQLLQKTNEELRQSEEDLRRAKAELEMRVERRTQELKDSEERLRVAAEISHIGFWSVENGSPDVWRNLTHDRLFGYDHLLPKWSVDIFLTHVHPEEREGVGEQVRQAIRDHGGFKVECRIKRIDGEWRWLEARGTTLMNPDGTASNRMMGTNMDITDRKNAEQAVTESESQFRSFADTMPQLAWIAKADGFIFWFNKRWYDYTGSTPKQMEGWGWQSAYKPKELPEVLARWNTSIATGKPFEMSSQIKGADQSYQWFLTRVAPVLNHSGEVVRWFGTNTNIDDQKRIQEDLSAAIHARDEFLSIASHELKTPLTTLKLQTQIAKKEIENGDYEAFSEERAKSRLTQTDKQISRLVRLIDDMLDISRIRSGKLTIQREPIDFCSLVKDVIERMEPEFLHAKATPPRLNCTPPMLVFCDRMRMEQVVNNILTNALRYGKGRPIEINVECSTETICLSVADQGIGISHDNLERIFNRFERAVSANEISGLGLGLYITKQIVLSHGGTIWATSELGKGSTFFVEIPRGVQSSKP
jgi:PAS domain S-box-containing protein